MTATDANPPPPRRMGADAVEQPLFANAQPMMRTGVIIPRRSFYVAALTLVALMLVSRLDDVIRAMNPGPAERLAQTVCADGQVVGWECSCAVASILGASDSGPGSTWWDVRSECREQLPPKRELQRYQ